MVTTVAIAGGGLAGGVAALLLAREGFAATVFEREREPHDKVCGEFLSVEACRDLAHCGIDLAHLGAVPIDRVRLASGHRLIEAPLPFLARGLSRRILDEAVLDAAARAGADVRRGEKVLAIEDGALRASSGALRAEAILLASGKHDIRALPRAAAATRDGYVGFKMHFRAPACLGAAIGSAIELVVFDGGYAGLQRVAPDVLNLCLIVRRDGFVESGATWGTLLDRILLEPWLQRRLSEAEPLFAKPLTIANLPYGYVVRAPRDGVYRLGDQAAMTASLTGDGMAIALRSARIAARALSRGTPPALYHREVSSAIGSQVRRAMFLQRATEHRRALTLALPLLAAWPGLLGRMAAWTRLPEGGAKN